MTELQASRTLVKSPPELWAECSDAASLARHLGQFGEIRITRLEPETAVAWEGEHARGTVRIEPAGWGTKVILTAVAADLPASVAVPEELPSVLEEPPPALKEPPPALEEPLTALEELGELPDEPAEPVQPADPPRRRRFAWLFARRRASEAPPGPVSVELPSEPRAIEPEPEAVESGPKAAAPEPEAVEPEPEPQPATSATEAALSAALDSLGQAHHRPYSRA
jgi:hypothetical protein